MVVNFCIAVKLDVVYGTIVGVKTSEQCAGATVGNCCWRQAL